MAVSGAKSASEVFAMRAQVVRAGDGEMLPQGFVSAASVLSPRPTLDPAPNQ